mmetsp:Transcript_16309/g.35276  ORF Transcript_16309/g.35276 Transcript_16309/m.35276 type:complete len:310 (+) Transcript_16309:167-1096(+)|eukprot:CAMPEP_0202914422 /NCGR_PEP_ID=MMETSP1392-20130828/63041_1 /ASSEMBLY_ACC=CAM_ASM_000868 /TAXON_ID=225041 /ORGANISM="Chlamydomonas chlamydogama, Strain SAG 11-48b" /LENGTH=309 /DNA_ID=CAMNT_0049606053 /DNA_START=79 /DNA_END=1008 /DNA_ORIENTATION=-
MGLSRLWQFDDEVPEDTGAWCLASQEVAIQEDENGNGKPTKKRRGPAKANATKGKHEFRDVANFDDDDDGEGGGSDDDFMTLVQKPALKDKQKKPVEDEDDDVVLVGTSAANTTAGNKRAKTGPSAAYLDDNTRKLVEEAQQLSKRLDESSRVDLTIDDDLCDAGALPLPARLPSLRPSRLQPLQAAHAGPSTSTDVDTAVPLQPPDSLPLHGGSMPAPPAPAADPDKIEVKCQSKKGTKVIRIKKTDPLLKLKRAFLKAAAAAGWLPSEDEPTGFRMIWDEETCNVDDTPDALGIEAEDVLDVVWKEV